MDQGIVECHKYMDNIENIKEVHGEVQRCSQVLLKCFCN